MKLRSLPVPAPVRLRLAVCADFHSVNRKMPVERALGLLEDAAPDAALFPGDLFTDIGRESVRACFNENGFRLITGARKIAPCIFSPGNHEMGLSGENRQILSETGIVVLDNEWIRGNEVSSRFSASLLFGGYSSGYLRPKKDYSSPPSPDPSFPGRFARETGFHILLSHHPEYWERFAREVGIELTVSGHAHGGQWRFFGRGAYAPGQGLFPRYTSGLYRAGHSVLAVSRGMTNSVPMIPRFFNPCEILLLELEGGMTE